MPFDYKKIALVTGFVVVVIAIGWLLWRVFFAPSITPPPIPADQSPVVTSSLPTSGTGTGGTGGIGTGTGGLPATGGTGDGGTGTGGSGTPGTAVETAPEPQRLRTGAVRAPRLADTGRDIVYYDANDGRFYRTDSDGRTTALSTKQFPNAQNVSWSAAGLKAVIEYPDGSNIVYDFDRQEQATLPAHWEEFSFAPDGAQIAAKSIGVDRDNRWLIVSDAAGGNAQALEPLGDNAGQLDVSWSPNNLSIALFRESVDFDRQRLYFIGKNNENFKSMTIQGRGFEHQWDPTGATLLYSAYTAASGLRPELWIAGAAGDAIGSDRRALGLQTWAHKCAFAGTTALYCAVPDSLPEGAGVFPQLANETSDSLYRIDLQSGARTPIPTAADATVGTLIVDTAEASLYYTDAATGALYRVPLR